MTTSRILSARSVLVPCCWWWNKTDNNYNPFSCYYLLLLVGGDIGNNVPEVALLPCCMIWIIISVTEIIAQLPLQHLGNLIVTMRLATFPV